MCWNSQYRYIQAKSKSCIICWHFTSVNEKLYAGGDDFPSAAVPCAAPAGEGACNWAIFSDPYVIGLCVDPQTSHWVESGSPCTALEEAWKQDGQLEGLHEGHWKWCNERVRRTERTLVLTCGRQVALCSSVSLKAWRVMQVPRALVSLCLWNSVRTLNPSCLPLSLTLSTCSERRKAERGRTGSDMCCGKIMGIQDSWL